MALQLAILLLAAAALGLTLARWAAKRITPAHALFESVSAAGLFVAFLSSRSDNAPLGVLGGIIMLVGVLAVARYRASRAS